MVPGDIDLTENLDFRNVKRREVPQLPASWKGKDRLNINNVNINRYIGNSYTVTWNYNTYYEEFFESDSNLTTTMTVRGIREVSNDYQLSWTTTIDECTGSTIYYWNDNIDYNTSYTSDDILSQEYDKPEYDIFGNRIKHPKPIPKIPWSMYKRNRTPIGHPIAWKRKNIWVKYNEDYIPNIPWDTEDYDWHYFAKEDLSTPIKRAKNLISWLSKKTSIFIERYFDKDDEKVDMSYLTNMSWIRVHDAVIDSI